MSIEQTIDLVQMLGPGAGEIIDTLADNGYGDLTVEQRNSEFVATAVKIAPSGQPMAASAIGRTRADAARSLVKAITRP